MEPNDFIVSDERLNHILKSIFVKTKSAKIASYAKRILYWFRSDPELYKQNPFLRHYVYELERAFEDIEACEKGSDDYRIKRSQLYGSVDRLYELCKHINNDRGDSDYNSKDYYENQISTLENKIVNLNQQLSESQQSQEQKAEITKELETTREQLEQAKSNNEELKKALDAQENLKGKIYQAFVELKTHIKPLEVEKKRLNWMFGVYAFLCVCVLVLLIYFEFKYLSKWESIKPEEIKLIDYLPFYIPVPIVGGLLWVFMYQMNRAQRQLMVVANVLYHVDYIEGLLLAINMISPNVAAASEKISQVLDNLIRNYISMPNGQFERSLDKELSKDSINVDPVFDLAKKVKDVIK